MRIAALTCRSFYSLLRGSVSVRRWVQQAAEYGYGAVALADVNSMSGVVDLCQAAAKTSVLPIVGVEILTDSDGAILLAEDDRGYGNLCRITTARNLLPDFDLVRQLQVDSRGVICICSKPGLLEKLKGVVSAWLSVRRLPGRAGGRVRARSGRGADCLDPLPIGWCRRTSKSPSSWRGYDD